MHTSEPMVQYHCHPVETDNHEGAGGQDLQICGAGVGCVSVGI